MPDIFLADLNDSESGSLWPAVLLHTIHNQFIMGIFDKLTGNTGVTPYITGEFGVGLAITGLVVAYVFWRMQREKPLRTRPVPALCWLLAHPSAF
jgi:CAAX protease family protein